MVACAFSVAVVVTSNIVRMAFFLVIALGATAGLYFLAGADFVGAMQLMIYVGGTLVLLVFGVMLTAQGPFISMRTRAGEWIVAAIVGSSLLGLLLSTAFRVDAWKSPTSANLPTADATATRLGGALLGYRVDRMKQEAAEEANATLPETSTGMSGYLMPFEVVSVHLLVVLIAAAYLARPKKPIGSEELPA